MLKSAVPLFELVIHCLTGDVSRVLLHPSYRQYGHSAAVLWCAAAVQMSFLGCKPRNSKVSFLVVYMWVLVLIWII